MAHVKQGAIAFYIIIALILGAITYIEFAIIEYEIPWLSSFWITFWLIALSVVKFVLVVAIYMHLRDDDPMYTGFFASGMVIALGTFIALSFLFTVRSVANLQTEAATEVHEVAEPETLEDFVAAVEERELREVFRSPTPKNQSLAVQLPAAPAANFNLRGLPLFGLGAVEVAEVEALTEDASEGLEPAAESDTPADEVVVVEDQLAEEVAEVTTEDIAEDGEAAEALAEDAASAAEDASDVADDVVSEDAAVELIAEPVDVTEAVTEEAGEAETVAEEVIEATAEAVETGVEDVTEAVAEEVEEVASEAEAVAEDVVEETSEAGEEAIDTTTDAAEDVAEALVDELTDAGEAVSEAVTDSVEAVVEGVSGLAETMTEAVTAENPARLELLAQAEAFDWQATGERVYGTYCVACHQATGQGIPGAFPPLAAHTPDLYTPEGGRDYLIKVVLYGLQGPIEVAGTNYNGIMTPWAQLSNEEIAAAINHSLVSWDNAELIEDFIPIVPSEVEALRGLGLAPAAVLEFRPELP